MKNDFCFFKSVKTSWFVTKKEEAGIVPHQMKAYLLVATMIVIVLLWFLLSCLLIGRFL